MGNIAGWDGKGWEAYFRGKENDKTKLEKLVYVTVKINVYVTDVLLHPSLIRLCPQH